MCMATPTSNNGRRQSMGVLELEQITGGDTYRRIGEGMGLIPATPPAAPPPAPAPPAMPTLPQMPPMPAIQPAPTASSALAGPRASTSAPTAKQGGRLTRRRRGREGLGSLSIGSTQSASGAGLNITR